MRIKGAGAAKRGRASSSNPFEHELTQTVAAEDLANFEAAFTDASSMINDKNLDVLALIKGIPNNALLQHLKGIKFGKTTHELKVKRIIEDIPQLANMWACMEKLKGSHEVLTKRFSGIVWQNMLSDSSNKFNVDLLGVCLKNTLKQKGVNDPDAMD